MLRRPCLRTILVQTPLRPPIAMHCFRFYALAVFAFTLSACDSATEGAATPSPATDLAVTYTSADRPLLSFADQTDFEATAAALEAGARNGVPLNIHSRFESFGVEDLFAPGAELALADENGSVVIGDRLITLDPSPSEVRSTIAPRNGGASKTVTRDIKTIQEMLSEALNPAAQRINRTPGSEDMVLWSSPIPVINSAGTAASLYYVVSHEAYKTWTGTERANAQTDALSSTRAQGIDQAVSIRPSLYVGLSVSARVVTVDNGRCVGYSAASSSSSSYVEIKAGGSRGLNQEITLSEHRRYGGWPEIPSNMTTLVGRGYNVNPLNCL